MLAQDNEYLRETSNAMYELDKDRLIRQQCQAREDFLYWERMKENRTKRMEAKIAEQEAELAAKDAELERQRAELEKLRARLNTSQ